MNDEYGIPKNRYAAAMQFGIFGLGHCFVLRHSCFVIRGTPELSSTSHHYSA